MYIAKKEDAPLEKYIFVPRLGTKRSLYFCIWKGTGVKYKSVGSQYFLSLLLLHDDYNASKYYIVAEIFLVLL